MKLDLYGFDDLEVKVYDPETKEVLGVYKSLTKAAHSIGIADHTVRRCCSNKSRRYSPVFKKEVVMRLVKKSNKNESNT
jgi:hypothetical protein